MRTLDPAFAERGRRGGFTVLELAIALLLTGALLGLAVPRAAAALDRIAVAAAREHAAAALARTRAVAVARGGATLVLQRDPGMFRIQDATGAVIEVGALAQGYGVALETSGVEPEIRIRYDALGIGRVASRTLRFRRGSASATLVISSYGRVSRR